MLVKPDGLQRGMVGEIIGRFEKKGLKLVGIKMITMSEEMISAWYAHLSEKPFFGEIKKYISWTPMVAMVWEGLEAIVAVRKVVGITKAREAEAGSIRGDLGMSGSQNLIHASDSSESAAREIGMVFNVDELFDYKSATDILIYSPDDLK